MKKILMWLLIIIPAVVLVFILKNRGVTSEKLKKVTRNLEKMSRQSETIKKYTLEEIGKHNKKEDCWLVIKGRVYDVTKFIALGQHPPVIEMGCGKDATTLFETRTTETGKKIGSGKPHSQKAKELLQNYYLGELTNK